MTTVEAIVHHDVRGNKMYYLKIVHGTKDHIISIGEKTHDAVKALLQDKPLDNQKNANDKQIKQK